MLRSNTHKTTEQRYDIDPWHQGMTRHGAKHNVAATAANYNDRYLGGQPWSSRVLKWNQDLYREPSNKLGYRFLYDKDVPRKYPTAGMLNQVHASAGEASVRTMPVRAKFNTTA